MSEILDIAHDMAKDLHEVGAMDDILNHGPLLLRTSRPSARKPG